MDIYGGVISRGGSGMCSAITFWRRRCGSSKSWAVDINDRLVGAILEPYDLPEVLSVHWSSNRSKDEEEADRPSLGSR